VAKSIELYKQVLAIDPNDAVAWAGLGRAYGTQGGYGYEDNDESHRKSKEAALKALELDDTVAEAHALMGWICLGFEHRFESAGREFRRAVELAPGTSLHLIGLAYYESTVGLFDDAIRHVEESIENDPLNPMLHHWSTRIYLGARRFDLAVEACTKALELSPGITSAAAIKGVALQHLGRLDEALESCLKEGSTGYRTCGLAIIYHSKGDKAKSDEQLAHLLAEGEQWGVQIAMVYAWRGEHDAAFQWLESALRLNDPGLSIVKHAPLFDKLHDDPRWVPYLKKVGFPD
jgi:tetratricopeptide (TPR) repeat protein